MTSTSLCHLTCLCGAISTPGTLLASPTLPARAELCHCNSCQHSSGALAPPFLKLNSSPSDEVISKAVAYKSSDHITRYFCKNCGCHCFLFNADEKEWFCLGGIIDFVTGVEENGEAKPKDLIEISQHIFIPDTVDGGLSPFLLNLNGRDIPTWVGYPRPGPPDLTHSQVLSLSYESITKTQQPGKDDYLPAKCHCGGVSLLIKRADYGAHEEARYIPTDRTKYLSYMCACRSCRLTTGVSLVPWTTMPPANVVINNKARTPLPVSDASSLEGVTLKHYRSSKNVIRSFCGGCGATIGYWNEERAGEVDLVVGIFRAKEGSMARGWLEWLWGRCSFIDGAVDEEIARAWKGCREIMSGPGGNEVR